MVRKTRQMQTHLETYQRLKTDISRQIDASVQGSLDESVLEKQYHHVSKAMEWLEFMICVKIEKLEENGYDVN